MTELHRTIHRVLDGLVQPPREQGDWGRVVADAQRSDRRAWLVRVAVVSAAAAVAVGAALVSPFEDDQQPAVLRTGVLGKALAAIGDGPVVHLVTRGDWGGDLVNLSTGEVTPVHAESEVWYDPSRGLRYVSRLGDRVQSDEMVPSDDVSDQAAGQYVALANRYREELRSGKAKVVARGRVGDRRVLWIRVRQMWLPDVADGKNHLFAEEVAVDRTTYEPVYMRSTRDGVPPPGDAGQLILTLETLPAGEGDFTAEEGANPPLMGGAGLGRHLTREDLGRALGGKAVWLGPTHAGKPLAETRVQDFRTRNDRDDEWEVVEGISLFYGSLTLRRGGIRLHDDQKPFVQLLEGTEVSPAWRGSELARDVPEDSVLVDAGGTGFLARDGVYVSVSAPEVTDVLAAATALRRVGDAPPPASGLNLAAIARRIERRELVHVEGLARVKPRSVVPRNAKRLQFATSKGVKVTTYRGGSARFDTRGMDPELQRLLPDELGGHCFRVHGDVAGIGASGSIPKNGVRGIAVYDHRGRSLPGRPPVSRRFDACGLGAQFGRNWLPRFDWHWPVELPLNERGRRFFEERAAALELAHFVRNGSRKRARRAMKRGAAAPPAASLRDPARPYIRVTARGNGFTASLTASTGRRFFIEIRRGRIGRSNAKKLAFVR